MLAKRGKFLSQIIPAAAMFAGFILLARSLDPHTMNIVMDGLLVVVGLLAIVFRKKSARDTNEFQKQHFGREQPAAFLEAMFALVGAFFAVFGGILLATEIA